MQTPKPASWLEAEGLDLFGHTVVVWPVQLREELVQVEGFRDLQIFGGHT